MNFKLLASVVVGVVAIGLFSAIVFTMPEDKSSPSEQQQELVQNEISKSSQITGIHAQTICKILDMDCPDHTVFSGYYDEAKGKTFVNYDYKKISYKFDVSTSEIKYRIEAAPYEWMTFENVF